MAKQDGHRLLPEMAEQDGHGLPPVTTKQDGHGLSPAMAKQDGHGLLPAMAKQDGYGLSPAMAKQDGHGLLQQWRNKTATDYYSNGETRRPRTITAMAKHTGYLAFNTLTHASASLLILD